MLLKVLRDPAPITRTGRPYSPDEIDFLWSRAQDLPIELEPNLASKLRMRQADGLVPGSGRAG